MPDEDGARIFLISGPSAAGKTTVARQLARTFARGVHLEGDLFRRSILGGRLDMTPSPSPDALAQLRLRYRLAASAADAYVEEGFTVVLEDVVAGPMLAELVAMLRGRPLHVAVLLPDPATLAAREAGRQENGYGAWSIADLHRLFAGETPRIGTWLDTSGQTPEETVNAVLRSPPTHE